MARVPLSARTRLRESVAAIADPTGQRLERCVSIEDVRRAARRSLPRTLMDHLEGGASDEHTLRRNLRDFSAYGLLPRILTDVSDVDVSTTVLGQPAALPVLCAPTGLSGLFHPDGELAVARAAARMGTIYTLSAMSSRSIEEVAAAAPGGIRWFQIYVWKDRRLLVDFIDRCRESGYNAVCLTVDVPTLGARERDRRNGMTVPPRITPRTLLEAAIRPAWAWRFLTGPEITMANVVDHAVARRTDTVTMTHYIHQQLDPAVTWDDLAWLRERWDGKLLIKGVLGPADAARAVELGCDAVIVSNHGGRQLDRTPSAIAALPAVVDSVAGRAEILLDGGVRRGTDVITALALGARAVLVGRPYLYGLAAGGQRGVERVLTLLREEIALALRLLGRSSIADIDSSVLLDIASGESVHSPR
jgi:L-lactate dehydrogenase (cytochrome)